MTINFPHWIFSIVAPSSIDIYESTTIPFWNKSLLIPTLKAGKIYRLHLNNAGTAVVDTSTIVASRGAGRFRDICILQDGLKIYAACDISGQTSGPTGSYNGGGTPPPNAGRILEFADVGAVLSIKTDSINKPNPLVQLVVSPNPASNFINVSGISNIKNR